MQRVFREVGQKRPARVVVTEDAQVSVVEDAAMAEEDVGVAGALEGVVKVEEIVNVAVNNTIRRSAHTASHVTHHTSHRDVSHQTTMMKMMTRTTVIIRASMASRGCKGQ